MSDPVEILIPGEAVPKGRPRAVRTKNSIRLYTPDKTANYETVVKIYAAQAMRGRPIMLGPVKVDILFYISIPPSWTLTKQKQARENTLFPSSKPDLDNTVKSLFDALNGSVWLDDRQVIDLYAIKRYSVSPTTFIKISEVLN